jgi:hypothetical protein
MYDSCDTLQYFQSSETFRKKSTNTNANFQFYWLMCIANKLTNKYTCPLDKTSGEKINKNQKKWQIQCKHCESYLRKEMNFALLHNFFAWYCFFLRIKNKLEPLMCTTFVCLVLFSLSIFRCASFVWKEFYLFVLHCLLHFLSKSRMFDFNWQKGDSLAIL